MKGILIFIVLGFLIQSCSDSSIEKKGFQVSEISEDNKGKKVVGLQIDSLNIETRPRNVLMTKNPVHRLTPIYKVNYDKKTGKPYTGSNFYHTTWENDDNDGNNWNNNFMPGFEAVYGYNLVNISHYNSVRKVQNEFFANPVLIKTLYYPAFSNDTLNYKPVKRNYYMVSVYDEDTNKDGFLTVKDLRRFYLFDIDGNYKKALIPKNYSVLSSEYDSENDFMYVFARIDQNNNGQMEVEEQTHIFWIDLKDPVKTGIQYKPI
jgi:hypothetical protein